MWEAYSRIVRRYPRLSLSEERRLISKAQKGSRKSKDEIIFRHISFLIFRISKITFPGLVHRFGEDLLEEAIVIAYNKIKSYDLDYHNKGLMTGMFKISGIFYENIQRHHAGSWSIQGRR